MKTDLEIQKDVMAELLWEPFLIASHIGVAVNNGVVTLSGQVDSYSKKLAAERAAKRVKGVKAIAEDIQIGVSPSFNRTDTEIAEAILSALKWHSAVQEEKIRIKVENGHVRLEGEVDWDYQRRNAESAIQYLNGVRSVLNLVTLKPKVTSENIERKISAAFLRHASIDAGKISVTVKGNKIILKGTVRSFAEKKDAENAAWAAAGVTEVVNQLEIDIPSYAFVD